MKLLGVILFLIATHPVFAQDVIFLDDESGEGVEGVAVLLQYPNGDSELLISDIEGHISIKNTPNVLKATHVAYETHEGSIGTLPLTIRLTKKDLELGEVIVTGQFQPQAINEAVFSVNTINNKQIEAQGAIDLADVLSNSLNITLTPDKGEGRTSISMLGLNGQYVKVLIDGVPFVSVDGNGNNVDITQINLNNIERVEIVEGPMAVNYGANAVAGVINLISKKGASNSLYIQEETVGNEYAISKGRHIQSLSLGHQFNEKFTINTTYRRNDFRGFQNGFLGSEHFENDGSRGYDWHPKLQNSGSVKLSGKIESHQYAYKLDLFKQSINRYNSQVFPDEHVPTGTTNPYAFDSRNENTRFTHSLSVFGQVNKVSYNVLNSFAGVEMRELTYRHRLLPDVEEEITSEDISYFRSAMSRGTLTNIFSDGHVDIQPGYEYTYEAVESASIQEGRKELHNLAAYLSAEWHPFSNFTFRPGVRTIYNSLFSSPLIYSTSIKYVVPVALLDIRASFGRSYRTPNLTEMFFYFVDTNHDVQGNDQLDPEDGHSLVIDIKKNNKLPSGNLSLNLKAYYNDITDQITLGIVNESPLRYQYINIDRFKSKGLSFLQNLSLGKFSVNTGISWIGRLNSISELPDNLDQFLYTTEINGNISYAIPAINLSFAAFYKHTGAVEQYIQSDNEGEFIKGKTDSFDWLDATTTWNRGSFSVSTGVKNILNITDVNTTAGQAGTHTGAATTVGRSYGRSYFIKMAYKFGQIFK